MLAALAGYIYHGRKPVYKYKYNNLFLSFFSYFAVAIL